MIVSTAAGRVSGRESADCLEFLGVPYSDPPSQGGLFDAPRPLSPWDGVLDATSFGATANRPAMSGGMLPEPVIAGSNCLNLNVYAPDAGPGAGLPVLVWIHGGAFVTGCNASPWYHGGQFARDGVMLVSVNYRLGAEGFLLTRDGPANRGILDLVAALRWVQDNIAAFGGDPGQVTIAGQSAGAMACLALLGCPAAAGMFRHAAAISPASPVLTSAADARKVAEEFCGQLGVPATAAALNEVDLASRLAVEQNYLPAGMSLRPPPSADERAAAMGTGHGLYWRPVVDGDVLTAEIPEAVSAAGISAFLIGTTTEEFNIALWPSDPPPSREACEQGFGNLGIGAPEQARYVAAARSGTWAEALAQAGTDATFRRPARRWADASASSGRPTYAYQFAWRSPGPFGAMHCLDLPFFFGNLGADGTGPLLGPQPPADLAADMHAALVSFARAGDPGWPAYSVHDRATKIFDVPSRVDADPFPQVC